MYNQFTLKVQHGRINPGPNLILSYDGTTKVIRKSVAEMVNPKTELFNWMVYDGTLHKWEKLPEGALNYPDKLHPVVSNKLKPELNIRFDTPDFKNRYPKHLEAIDGFFQSFINKDVFKKIVNHNGFIQDPQDHIYNLKEDSKTLLFGKGTGVEPKFDLKLKGPCRPLKSPANVKIFFIYQEGDQALRDTMEGYLLKGYKNHNSLAEFIKLPFSIDKTLDITFQNINTAIREVYTVIHDRPRNPTIKYFAFYISPVNRFAADFEHKRVYYRMKEMLLNYDYQSQVIVRANVNNPMFNFFLPNIETAMLGKLGGIPWRLNRTDDTELVVGIGVFYSRTRKSKYVGSAFCFNNLGEFKGFRCFPGNEMKNISGSIRDAVTKFQEDNRYAKRLIIHFFQVMNKKKLKEIRTMLYHELKLEIPIIIVTINKTESKDIVAFDVDDNENYMPYSGTYINVGEREYLLFNNVRYDETSKPNKKEFHFPIKLKFSGSDLTLFEDKTLVETLVDQVYQFSRMYWKTVSQQNLPVTLKYPEMIADIFPNFKYDKLPDLGENSLWFL